jgi:hypothetical protein
MPTSLSGHYRIALSLLAASMLSAPLSADAFITPQKLGSTPVTPRVDHDEAYELIRQIKRRREDHDPHDNDTSA